jgi:hypothetical protein
VGPSYPTTAKKKKKKKKKPSLVKLRKGKERKGKEELSR